jgi:predicted GNAT family N-acyltransferase
MTEPVIRTARNDADRELCFAIRAAVFVEEQGVARDAEFDAHDATATHLLAVFEDQPLGTMRWRLTGPGRAKLERVAVLAQGRGRGIGLALVRKALRQIAALGAEEAVLHAQTQAAAFYRRLGFVVEGEPFAEEGIEHIRMRLDLAHRAA